MEHALTQPLLDKASAGADDRARLMLLLSAGDDHYALDARDVREVLPAVALARLSGVPEGLAGLMNHHGRMVPVVDLCRLTLGRDCEPRLSTRILMLRHRDSLVGLRAERVTEGVWVAPADLTRGEAGFREAVYLRREVGGRTELVCVLSLDRLLPEAIQLRLSAPPAQET